MRFSAAGIALRMSMIGSGMVVVYPRTGAGPPVGCGRRPMRPSIDQAGLARGSLLSYVEDLPRFGAREAYLWREGARWRRRTYADLHRRAPARAEAPAGAGGEPGAPPPPPGPPTAHSGAAPFPPLRAGGGA